MHTDAEIAEAAVAYRKVVKTNQVVCPYPEAVLRWALKYEDKSAYKRCENGDACQIAASLFISTHRETYWLAMSDKLPDEGWRVWFQG